MKILSIKVADCAREVILEGSIINGKNVHD